MKNLLEELRTAYCTAKINFNIPAEELAVLCPKTVVCGGIFPFWRDMAPCQSTLGHADTSDVPNESLIRDPGDFVPTPYTYILLILFLKSNLMHKIEMSNE